MRAVWGALLLDDGVGSDGETVANLGDGGWLDAELAHAGADAVEDGAGVVVGVLATLRVSTWPSSPRNTMSVKVPPMSTPIRKLVMLVLSSKF